jgi:hypothetical protein
MKNYALPRLHDIIFLSIFIAVLFLGPRMLNTDGDLPRHLLMGKIVLETRSIPTKDIFSHVYLGQPLTPHEWLSGVIFYIFYSFLGLNGVVILAAILLATTFTLVYSNAAITSGVKLPTFFLTFWGAAVSSLHWIARPHLFSMLFLAIFLISAEKVQRKESQNIWVFPVVMLIWGNLHGEFIAGFLVLAAYSAGWLWNYILHREVTSVDLGKRFGLAMLFSFLATLINPVGLSTWKTVMSYLGNRYLMSHIIETNPPNFSQNSFLVLLGLLVFSIFLLSINKERLSTAQGIALAGFSAMVLVSARNVHLYGVAAPLLLAATLKGTIDFPPLKHIENILSGVEAQIRGFFWPVATVLILGLLTISGFTGIENRFNPKTFPIEALNWLEEHPQSGKMFNSFDWGGYILWRLWPEQLPFIDSQTDVRGDVTKEYEKVLNLTDDWQSTLNKYNVSWAIIPQDWALTQALKTEGWTPLYQDNTAAILHKP